MTDNKKKALLNVNTLPVFQTGKQINLHLHKIHKVQVKMYHWAGQPAPPEVLPPPKHCY